MPWPFVRTCLIQRLPRCKSSCRPRFLARRSLEAQAERSMPKYRFWIHSKDRDGRPLEDAIVQAAENNVAMLTHYRENEIGCESTINALLQTVVESASKAHRRRPIRNPAAYLLSCYQHAADKFLDRERRMVSMDTASLELTQIAETASWEDEIHRRLIREKIIKAMGPEGRRIAELRLAGYSMNEIGRALSENPRQMYFRYRREVQKALKKVLGASAAASHERHNKA